MSFEILDGGLETTIQDYPGRLGYYSVGIPNSGPADDFAFRLANLLVKEPVGEVEKVGSAQLEVVVAGPKLRFKEESVIAVTGADLSPKIEGNPISLWECIRVKAGDTLSFGHARRGCRAYVAISGGVDVPVHLGSRSTYKYGFLGGFNGRPLNKGDIVEIGKARFPLKEIERRKCRPEIIPHYPGPNEEWTIRAMPGPQDDYYDEESMDLFRGKFLWKISLQSDRMGIRMEGPQLKYKSWNERPPSQDPLAHPSNIIGCLPYAAGSVNICGDTPIILHVDRVTVGGYCCHPAVISADFWKLGQLKVHDTVRFQEVNLSEARKALLELEKKIDEKTAIVA